MNNIQLYYIIIHNMGYILQITGCDFCMLDEKMHVKKDMAVTAMSEYHKDYNKRPGQKEKNREYQNDLTKGLAKKKKTEIVRGTKLRIRNKN